MRDVKQHPMSLKYVPFYINKKLNERCKTIQNNQKICVKKLYINKNR